MSNISIKVKNGSNSFDVTSVGFDTEKQYTVAEFNQALKKANEKWQENWDGLSYPSNIIIVTVENLHNEPCTYRVNLTDADYNSIQDIVDLSPTPMHASISTEKAIKVLNKAEEVIDRHEETERIRLAIGYKDHDMGDESWRDTHEIISNEGKLIHIFKDGYYGKYGTTSESEIDKQTAEQLIKDFKMSLTEDGEKLFAPTPVKVENIPQLQDISHNTNNAALSAAKANGQKRSITMSNNTKLSVSSMTILGDDSSAKAYASVTINDEFVIKNVKVFEGKNGLFVTMPSRKSGNEYSDVVFPISKEAREQFINTVIDCYNDMQNKGQESFMSEFVPPTESKSNITASVQLRDYKDSNTKAVGQITIDEAFVVSGVKVVAGKDDDGKDYCFASMPSYLNDVDESKDYAYPITTECYEKVQNAVLEDYSYIQNYHEMGGKENLSTAYNLDESFADKLSAELNKNGIENLVKKNDGRANISVKLADKEQFAEIRKDLAQTLQQERRQEREGGKKSLSERIDKAKAQQPEKPDGQEQAKQPHKKPKAQEL
ncbi:MAG: SpoVG family protein [Oscillospiraceae bacterium]|nr:SpoVG family protein [Oscillospiraceae bacterium]